MRKGRSTLWSSLLVVGLILLAFSMIPFISHTDVKVNLYDRENVPLPSQYMDNLFVEYRDEDGTGHIVRPSTNMRNSIAPGVYEINVWLGQIETLYQENSDNILIYSSNTIVRRGRVNTLNIPLENVSQGHIVNISELGSTIGEPDPKVFIYRFKGN